WVWGVAQRVETDDAYSGDGALPLLLEIVEELRGLPGLAEFARGGGRRAGENFLAWFDAARRDGDDAMAALAGEEGLRNLKRSWERAGAGRARGGDGRRRGSPRGRARSPGRGMGLRAVPG